MKNTMEIQVTAKPANNNLPNPSVQDAIDSKPSQTLVVVLGMHRSGTSAITRALKVLGVELGDTMIPPVEGENPKGFWEDIDLNALNIEMLDALGSDWHHLSAITEADVEALRNQGYFLSAVELLRKKINGMPVFGFKDPRVAKLLPFWKEVFDHCQCDVRYILAVRHPLSVVKSLTKRDGFDAEKCYLLWLNHVLTSLSGSIGNKCILVDYDLLMHAPDYELNRIAKQFDLNIDPDELQNYKMEFLDQNLRHTIYHLEDLFFDVACPPMVREVYAALLDLASDKIQIDDAELLKKIEIWTIEFKRVNVLLALTDKLYVQKNTSIQTIAERDGQIANLAEQYISAQAVAEERATEIASLAERYISANAVAEARAEEIASLAERYISANAVAEARAEEIASLAEQYISANSVAEERAIEIASLLEKLKEIGTAFKAQSAEINRLKNQIALLEKSLIWRLKKLLRVK